MEPTDRKAFAACLLGVAEIYRQDLSDAVARIWWEALRLYDMPAVADAFSRHVASPDVGQFMPKPADIIRMLAGTSKDAALVAWSKTDRAVRHVGAYASVAFDDPLVHRVLQDMGGWVALCEKTDDEWPFVRNEFVNRYQGYRSSGLLPEYPTHLVGIVEHYNGRNGHRIGELTFIGDVPKAVAVSKGGSTRSAIGLTRLPALLELVPEPKAK
jgi:hypothetical protein